MRNIGFIVIIIFSSVTLMAQPNTSAPSPWRVDKFYGSIGTVLGKPGIFLKGATGFYFKNQWGLSVEGMQTYYKAKNIPAGYKSDFCLFGNCNPKDRVQIYSLNPERVLSWPGKHTSVIIGAGPSYVAYAETKFTPASSTGFGSFFDGSNYDEFTIQQHVLGLSVQSRLQFRATRHIALGLGWFSNFNKAQSVHGVEVSAVFGRH